MIEFLCWMLNKNVQDFSVKKYENLEKNVNCIDKDGNWSILIWKSEINSKYERNEAAEFP